MCSIPGLPTPGSNVSVLITRVNCNPQCDIVELWGNFDQEREIAYQRLRKDIQFPREIFRELEGNPGDVCLVQIYETWYRVRIVSRNGSSYNVFLIDEGRMLGVTTSMLAWGQKEFFHLPPEVEFCVLSNVLPLSPENRWSPVALEFLKSLCGKTVDACVQDILVPHRTFLLDVPCVSRQMHEMGFAKKLSTDKFKLYVSKSLQSGASNSTEDPQKSSMRNDPIETREQIEKQQHYMYPELQTETVETVVVTEVTNPLRVFCQLKVFSQELKKLTEQITQHYEGRVETGITRPEMLGSPCASRASDGRWYRSMLQQVFTANNVVEVLHVDYGKKQFVQAENIRPLATEFFRMPVVTYVCSLHGVIDKGVGWTAAQIEYLKSLLLNRTVIAKFEYQSLSEGVHYVTLYGNENTNINKLFGTKERCLLDSEKSHGDYAVRNNCASPPHPDGIKFEETAPPSSGDPKEIQAKYPAEDLPLNSSHVAVIQHVENPSEFWIHTQMYADAFNQMMNDLADLYSNPVSAGVVECPKVGLYCAARSQDNSFYRATVSEVTGHKARVFFFDYGNTEMIDWFNLGVLPDKFKELPALALKCRLAGIRPKEEKWSRNATDFFTKSIADKILDVHVTAKSHGAYIVQLMDSSAHGERDVSKLLCSAGFAEKGDTSKTPHKASSRPIIAPTTQNPRAIPYDVFKASVGPQGLSTSDSTVKESRTAFKEYLFPIGSSVEVTVSYIESPNDFWCQLAQNSNHLKWLMQDIQQHYADTEFGQPVEPACVARHPDNGMWYRALVIQKHATLHVDVLFIDYGQTKTVSLQDLRRIDPNFVQLKGQAFRCSLYNLILPTSHTTEWPEDAIRQFQDFVDTAASDHRVLKCTIYAVMYNAQKVVFNVVDLETPFQSVCNLMVQKGLANRAPAKKVPSSPFRLDTYYYSTHNIKTGSEEEVTVTSVKNVNHFYCQLKRNADTVKGLAETINTLCRQLEITNCPQTFGTVCFAKYTDGEWYRGQIKSRNPTILVHFVDYGDTLEVKKSDLLPIPIEASEIMSVPVQAVQCGLSDIPGEVTSEVNGWFETSMTDRNFRALVVAKEPGGKLLVELYDRKMQVNAKIKEKFNLEMHREEQVLHQSRRPHDGTSSHTSALEAKPQSTTKEVQQKTDEDTQKFEKLPQAPYRTYQKRVPLRRPNERVCSEARKQPEKIPQAETKGPQAPKPSLSEPQKEIVVPKAKVKHLPKLSDLPSKSINPGMVADVFVSHCNSPQSFFVQLIKEEDDIYSIVEKLNDEQSTAATIHTKDLSQGDLVSAEFPDDSSWYRAVVSEILGNETALVEFIDFGNTATVSVSKICQLDKHFLEIPRFSILCFLSGVTAVGNQAELNPEVVSNFKEKVGLNGNKRLGCMFMKQSGSFWEVGLVHGSKAITCNISPSSPTASSDVIPETSESSNQEAEEPQQSPSARSVPPEMSTLVDVKTARYSKPDISEGQTVEVYASTINGPQSFWCQSAESDKLDKITEVVADAGNAVASTLIDTETLCIGSPCIALFVDDEQWYRAEVLRKDVDALSILFVDYGNESTVNLKDVRPMPTVLIDTPPQAFQCQLEGFDYSQGSWHDTAADQLSELIKDKLLHLTVLRVSSQNRGGITCFLKVKCEEEIINDTMKLYWKSSVDKETSEDEDKSDPSGVAMSGDTPSLVGEFKLVEEEAAVLNSRPEEPDENVREHDKDYALARNETHELVDEDKCADISDEQQGNSVLTQATDEGHAEDVDLISFQVDAECFDHLGNTASIDHDKEEEKLSYTIEIQESMTAIQGLSAKTTNEGKVTKSIPIIICEEPSDAGLECLSESGDSCEAQAATSQGNKDILVSRAKKDTLEVYKDESGSVSVLEKAFSLDDSESRLYFDEHFDQTSLSDISQGQDDIYEEVFKLCAEPVVESAKSEYAVTEESDTKDEELETLALELETKKEESGIRDEDVNISAVVPESEFGKLQRVEPTVPVGSSSCVVWSSAKKSWCKAKILKIFEDSIKVLLLDHDTEMIVDPHNIFEPLSSEPEESDDFDTASSNAGSESDHEDTDDSDSTVAGDDLSKAASEVQDDSTLADVCAPLDESSDVLSEQLVDIEPATDVEVVSSVPTQDNKDDVLEEDPSCLREVTSCLIGDCLVTSTDDGAEIKKETYADGISSATPQERDDLRGESKSSPDEDCLVSTEQRTDAQEATVVEVTSSAPTQDKDDLLCHEEVCSDYAEQFAEIEEATDVEVVSSAATQDKNDVQLEQEMSFPGEDSAEVVMSQVTHLSLRVEENSDDDIIFVSESRTTQEQSQSSD
ncbi:tudor domain-containing 6 [Salmo salar]|uniref:Tudor domain-containing 6 n=1 Tax=Salmo salar TaxID=8030 RepID=A0A1S3SAD6_SALSA|nr:tudor domain-containing 6 [Salmo salar]